ncbi:cyanogenic beta-glucosidase-like [Manihot esculenta]|uniref:cyanogenic beta-glucosidase-like n=1 Tax=Manihot esculenta TaxID=3983 RepID=UPI000B5D7F03|nr:cyanogenic beta-glucosidase-like [Manihot esculenta]
MASKLQLIGMLIFFLISLLALTKPTMANDVDDIPVDFDRSYFPDDLIFGTATSAYQVGGDEKGVNEEGIEFYIRIINETIKQDFREYANLLFKRFGDRVKHLMTFNKPWALSGFAHDDGFFAPGRCSSWVNNQCRVGNSAIEPYIVAYHLLLSHSKAVQTTQKGKIGITLFTFWFEPLSNRRIDIEASRTSLDFMFGLRMDPLTYSQYPKTVQNLIGDKLLNFIDEETQLLRGSYDFIGLQYYTSYYAKPNVSIDSNCNV